MENINVQKINDFIADNNNGLRYMVMQINLVIRINNLIYNYNLSKDEILKAFELKTIDELNDFKLGKKTFDLKDLSLIEDLEQKVKQKL